MAEYKQKKQENAAAGETTGKKKFKARLSFGKILVLILVAVAMVYMFFSVHLFYNFVKIMIHNPDAAKQQGAAAEALDESYADAEE